MCVYTHTSSFFDVYVPQQNGRAERKHHNITKTGVEMLFNAHAFVSFLVDAFVLATYIINRLPTKVLDHKTPFELLFGSHPNYDTFHVFGYRVFPYLRDYSHHKMAPRSVECVFIGYEIQCKGYSYKCLDWFHLMFIPLVTQCLMKHIICLLDKSQLLILQLWFSLATVMVLHLHLQPSTNSPHELLGLPMLHLQCLFRPPDPPSDGPSLSPPDFSRCSFCSDSHRTDPTISTVQTLANGDPPVQTGPTLDSPTLPAQSTC